MRTTDRPVTLPAERLVGEDRRVPTHDEIERLYGPWRAHVPADAVALMSGYDGPWWIAGGWAIEAFTGAHRHHSDLDLSVPHADVPRLRGHLAGTFDVWAADKGALYPLVAPEDVPSATCGNLWLRRSGAEPWEYDVILMTTTPTTWTYKRDGRITRAFAEILQDHDGVAFLRPEVQLLHKAKSVRPKDQADFDACLPLLGDGARAWLAGALAVAHPGHPWERRLRS
jgi:hypothetical protein